MNLVQLVASDVQQIITRFHQFHTRFAHHFATETRTMAKEAKQYLHGQLVCQRKGNLMQFEKIVAASKQQSLHHFVSNSPWASASLLADVCESVAQRIGDKEHGSLHIDESGFEKNGNHSVGVARQYCGRLGKVDNCQVGVFLGYAHDRHRILIDKRLYLPQEWTQDWRRRKKCGVPDDVPFATKAQLGLEMIKDATARGLPYAWIGMDCHYGQQPWLNETLEEDHQQYIADVPCDTRVFLDSPCVYLPQRQGNRGRLPSVMKVCPSSPAAIPVNQIAAQLEESQWVLQYVRDTERGQLFSRFAVLRVYPVRDQLPGPQTWLILRKTEGSSKIKYQLCNAPVETPFARLVEMSHSRYWVERAIEDAKGEAGLADYQVRGWRGWHHHMALVILAMLFLLEMQLDFQPKAPDLTLRDVREILEQILPQRTFSPSEIPKLIEQKHKRRRSARRSHHRRRRQSQL